MIKHAAQMNKGRITIKDSNNAAVGEIWVSDDPNIGYRIEYWLFYTGYVWPGPNANNVTYTFQHASFNPDISGDDVAVYLAFKDYIADQTQPNYPYAGWVRAACVSAPTLHLCP